jgi:hypothetical protein
MIADSPAHFCLVCYAALADDRPTPFRSYEPALSAVLPRVRVSRPPHGLPGRGALITSSPRLSSLHVDGANPALPSVSSRTNPMLRRLKHAPSSAPCSMPLGATHRGKPIEQWKCKIGCPCSRQSCKSPSCGSWQPDHLPPNSRFSSPSEVSASVALLERNQASPESRFDC